MKTVNEHKEEIIINMKRVRTYNESFEPVIQVLARTLYEYSITTDKFEDTGSEIILEHTNRAGITNKVKNPLYLALEKLRDDVIAYSKELGLTPAGLKRLNDELDNRGGTSKLANVLNELEANDK